MENSMEVSKKLTLGHTSGEKLGSKVHMHPMLTAALFTIAKTQKQLNVHPPMKKKMWYIYKIEYYSAIRKNEVMSFATTWMDLEIIILNEVYQTEKDKYHMILLILEPKKIYIYT